MQERCSLEMSLDNARDVPVEHENNGAGYGRYFFSEYRCLKLGETIKQPKKYTLNLDF